MSTLDAAIANKVCGYLALAACRRSDLEILSYCMVQWLCERLPWEDKLQDPLYVRDSKIRLEKS